MRKGLLVPDLYSFPALRQLRDLNYGETQKSRSPAVLGGIYRYPTAGLRDGQGVQQGKRTAPAGSRQITKEKTMTERFEMIERAYSDALGGRDPEHVNIVELLPAI